MVNSPGRSRSAGSPGPGHRDRGLPGPPGPAALSRRSLIGGAVAAGLGAAVLEAGAASASQLGAGRQAEPEGAFSPETARVLQAIIASGALAANLPGLNVGAWVPGRGSYVQAIGVSDVSTAAPLQLDDHFRIASITKTFTATAILQLVDQNRISLDDHLGRYITGIPYGNQITIDQLLGMTSGVYDFVNDAEFVAG